MGRICLKPELQQRAIAFETGDKSNIQEKIAKLKWSDTIHDQSQ